MAHRLLALLFSVAIVADAAVTDSSRAKVSPMEKVIQLLKGLQEKITKEGQTEAANYEKYACYCRDQAIEKQGAIESSTKEIASLTIKRNQVQAAIEKLALDISGVTQDIISKTALLASTKTAATTRMADFAKADEKLVESIGNVGEAVKRMSTGQAGVSFSETDVMEFLQLQSKLSQPAKPSYTHQGGNVLKMLEKLEEDFLKAKKGADMDEIDKKGLSDTNIQGLNNAIKFAEKAKAEKNKESADKDAQKAKLVKALDQEIKDKAASTKLFKTLTTDCENKATTFDARSKSRVDELTAMTNAMTSLKTGAGAKVLVQDDMAPSFVQIHQTNQQDETRVVNSVLSVLRNAASELDSSFLRGAAVRVQIQADHFVKVRGLIKDLLKALTDKAAAEATKKAYCDSEMTKSTTQRDTSQLAKEKQTAIISTKKAEKQALVASISKLTKAIAKNAKAKKDSAALRGKLSFSTSTTKWSDAAAEKVTTTTITPGTGATGANEASVKESTEGSAAVGVALTSLNDFYKKGGGEQSAGKGIIAMLEVIQADFDRATASTKAEEEKQALAWAADNTALDADSLEKATSKTAKEADLATCKSDLITAREALSGAKKMLKASANSLDKLKLECITNEETTEQRFAKRKKEIEGLKDAQKILEQLSS